MSWLRSWPSTNRFILVPPNPREEYQITRFHTTSGGFEQYPPTGRSPGQCGRNAGRRRRHPCLVHNSAVSGHDTDVRLLHRDIQASKIFHVWSPLPKDEAESIGLRGRATDHYPMLKNSLSAMFDFLGGLWARHSKNQLGDQPICRLGSVRGPQPV